MIVGEESVSDDAQWINGMLQYLLNDTSPVGLSGTFYNIPYTNEPE